MRLLSTVLLVATIALAGCSSSGSEPAVTSTTTRPLTTTTVPTTEAVVEATVEGAFGCGPADGRTLVITAHDLPDVPVLAQVVVAGKVRNQEGPLTKTDLVLTVEPDLPGPAYEPGATVVRIVRADAPDEVLATAPVDPDLPMCG